MIHLGQWLRENATRVRDAGAWDCSTFPAAWVMANGLPDPMAQWRGRYDTEEAALALIDGQGGLPALFSRAMSGIDAPLNRGEPVAGDIGLVAIYGLEAGAIFTGKRWAFVTDRGMAFVTIAPEHIVAAWSLPHG
jgi:hypothetical protein